MNISLSNIDYIYYYIIATVSIPVVISALEYLYLLNDKNESKLPDWKLYFSTKTTILNNKYVHFLCKKNAFKILLALNIFSVICLLFVKMYSFAWTFLLILLLIGTIISNLRDMYGMDGADQQKFAIILLLLIATGFWTNANIKIFGLLFLALQTYLTYFVAGLSKILSKHWRNGSALSSIFATSNFGNKHVAVYFLKSKKNSLIFGWLVMILLTGFPISLFFSADFLVIYLFMLFLFHFSNAIIMGLNLFPWVYLASYPAILFIHVNKSLAITSVIHIM